MLSIMDTDLTIAEKLIVHFESTQEWNYKKNVFSVHHVFKYM